MDLVKIGNEYVNPEQVVSVSYSRTMDGDKYVVSVYLVGGRVVKEVVKQSYSVKTVIERLTTTSIDIKACARKIKEYCAERAYGRCKSCALYDNGCFVGHAYKDELTDSYDVDYPLDWDLD